jgi:hypothetical protein
MQTEAARISRDSALTRRKRRGLGSSHVGAPHRLGYVRARPVKPLKKGATYDDLRDVPDHFVAEMFDG